MYYIPLAIQGGLVGMIAGAAYPEYTWEFWAVLLVNAVLTTMYGELKASNR
jgi:hypothetical protein